MFFVLKEESIGISGQQRSIKIKFRTIAKLDCRTIAKMSATIFLLGASKHRFDTTKFVIFCICIQQKTIF